MQTMQFIYDHWGAISGWLVAAYHVISNAGGLRTIAANLVGPNKPTEPAKQPTPEAPAESKTP